MILHISYSSYSQSHMGYCQNRWIWCLWIICHIPSLKC